MRKVITILLLLALTGCSAEADLSTETIEIAQSATEEIKTSEIATESRLRYDPDYGEPPEEVQRIIDDLQCVETVDNALETLESTEESTGEIDVNGYGWVELQYSAPYHIMEGHLTRSNGSIRCFGHRETWYSTNEGCGQTTARSIPGKHVADDGTIRDEDGYICVASSDLPFYSIVMTSVGPGKVYDCGCSNGTIDVYTTW